MKKMKGKPYLEVRRLNLTINKQLILNSVNFNVNESEILSIIGPSGCGKSSILKCIAGVNSGCTGTITLDGKDITTLPINHRDTTLVFQDYSLFPHMTTKQNMQVACEDFNLVSEVLHTMNIFHLLDKYPHQMSGGEQQRVALARAIAYQPKLLLLDEPFSNIDAITTKQLRGAVKSLIDRFKITTIMVTHDMDDVFEMSNRCVVMDKNHVAQFDTNINIYTHPTNEFVMDLFGNTIEYNGRKYRPEDLEISFIEFKNDVQAKVKNVKFKLNYNEVDVIVDSKLITVFDYKRIGLQPDDTLHLRFK